MTPTAFRIAACWGATLHAAMCSGGEGHPHRDCYCNAYWNDNEPKMSCPTCAEENADPTPEEK